MSYSAADLVQDLQSTLEALRFSFHEGNDDDLARGYPDGTGYWACWTGPEGCDWDVECTDTRDEGTRPLLDAPGKYIDHAEETRRELLAALRVARDCLDTLGNNAAYGDTIAGVGIDAIDAAAQACGLELPDGNGECSECGAALGDDGKCFNNIGECSLCGEDQPPPPIVVDGKEYEYLTAEWRDGQVCVHGWGTYPESSVLSGQASKTWIDSFPTMEKALAEYPQATPSHPLLQPQVSLNHLSDEGDL